jgi:trehalose/maltose transport system substrate-binding protein
MATVHGEGTQAMIRRLVFFSAMAFLTACSQPEDDSSPPPSDQRKTLRFFANPAGQGGEISRKQAARYSKLYDVNVELATPEGSASTRLAQAMQLLERGTGDFDVYQVDIIWCPILHEHFIDLAPNLQDREDFFAPILENNTVHGRLVGVPLYTDVGLIFYRADLLEKYGFKAPPKTYEELESMAAKIMEGENQTRPAESKLWGYVFDATVHEGLTCLGLEWQSAHGGGSIIEPDGTVSVNNPRTVVAFQMVSNWIGKITPPEVTSMDLDGSRRMFSEGRAVFLRSWCFAKSMTESERPELKGKIGVARLPAGPAGSFSAQGGWQLAVAKSSANQEEAIRFIQFMTSADNQRERTMLGGFAPARRSVYSEPTALAKMPELPIIMESLDSAVFRPSSATGAAYNEITLFYSGELHRILTGKTDAPNAVATMEAQFRLILEQ